MLHDLSAISVGPDLLLQQEKRSRSFVFHGLNIEGASCAKLRCAFRDVLTSRVISSSFLSHLIPPPKNSQEFVLSALGERYS